MWGNLCVQLLVFIAVSCGAQTLEEFYEEYIWSSLDFVWPDDTSRAGALSKSQYQPENNALSGIRVWRDRIYLTIPRWKPGVPATLVSIPTVSRGRSSPPLEPFPSWEMQVIGNCSAFQFVQNIEIDRKGQMWVLDSGRINTMTRSPDSKCRPKLVLLDLQNTGSFDNNNNMKPKILQTFFLPDSVLSKANDSVLVDLVLDNDDVVYISDASPTDSGIIVFNTWSAQAWKVSDATMQGNPSWRTNVGGMDISFNYGVSALALTPVPVGMNDATNRTLFYSPLSSYNLYAVSTFALKNQKVHSNIQNYISDLGNKSSFSQGMTIDSHGIMYLGLNSMDSIARWDTRKLPFQSNMKVFTMDSNRMQWPSTLSIDTNGSLWVISNRLQNFIQGTVNLGSTNYRVMRAITNTSSYQYPEERPSADFPQFPTHTGGTFDHSDHTNHMDHTDHMDHTQRPGGTTMDHGYHKNNTAGNAAESVARPTSVVLTILTSIMTFILALS